MAERARVISKAEIARLRAQEAALASARQDADALRAKAEAEVAAFRAQAEADALEAGQAHADEIVAAAEAAAKAQLEALEGEVSELVAQTVEKVIGDLDQSAAIKAATKTALARLSADTSTKIRAAPAAYRAAQAAAIELAPDVEVRVDESLNGDRVIASDARGHTEIGLSAQTEAATAPWREAT